MKQFRHRAERYGMASSATVWHDGRAETSAPPVVTEEAKSLADFLVGEWGHLFDVQLEVRLSTLFPKPRWSRLCHIWKHGSADLAVFREQRLVAIVEVGGPHHFDALRARNDENKARLAITNHVSCAILSNEIVRKLSKRRLRALLGAIIFGSSGRLLDRVIGPREVRGTKPSKGGA